VAVAIETRLLQSCQVKNRGSFIMTFLIVSRHLTWYKNKNKQHITIYICFGQFFKVELARTQSHFKARSHLSVAKLSTAKIAIQLQMLPAGCIVATLHKTLICFTEHTLKELIMKLCSATLKCVQAFKHETCLWEIRDCSSIMEYLVLRLLRLNKILYALMSLLHRSCSLCMSFVRLGHHNG